MSRAADSTGGDGGVKGGVAPNSPLPEADVPPSPLRKPEYGGIAREDRITAERYCDKAWHLDTDEPVKATIVLTCALCGRVYARCAQCNRGGSSCSISMRAHFLTCAQRRRSRYA